jgi:Electron transfer DM13
MRTTLGFTSNRRLGVTLGGLAVLLPLAWYLGSPLFLTRAVSEAVPLAPAPARAGGTAAGPQVLATGQFGVVDALHHGQGLAKLLLLPNGARVLRFEDFAVTNGPDVYVYLSGHPGPRDGRQLHERGTFELGQLKGNVGAQNYELPADLGLDRFASAVIYCRRFSVIFSTAALLPTRSEP